MASKVSIDKSPGKVALSQTTVVTKYTTEEMSTVVSKPNGSIITGQKVIQNGPGTFVQGISSETLLICGVCHSQLKEPKILPCVHTFCKRCVDGLIKDGSATLECPTCKESITVPRQKANGFRDNLFLLQLQGISKAAAPAAKLCEVCEEEGHKAVEECLDCQELMCKTCAKAHRRMKATKKHKMAKIIQPKKKSFSLKSTPPPMLCDVHKSSVKKFCMMCDAPACDKCLKDLHKSHRTVELFAAAAEKRKVLQVTMTAICQKASQLQALVSNAESIKARLETHQKLQVMAVEEKMKDLLYSVERIGQEFKYHINKKMGDSIKVISEYLQECFIQMRTFQTIIEFGNKLMEHGAPRDVVTIERDLVGRLKALDTRLKTLQKQPLGEFVENSKIIFVPGVVGDVELRNFFGDMSKETDDWDEVDGLEENITEITKPHTKSSKKRPVLHRAENPWVPYFRRTDPGSPTGNELMNAKIREELCFRSMTSSLNKLCQKNFTSAVIMILDCQIDTEVKLQKLCDMIITVASNQIHLVQMFALLCRCISFLAVPTEGKPNHRSTVLNFLERYCLRRFATGEGAFLASGMTPLPSRSNSISYNPGSRRPSLMGHGSLDTWGPRTPQVPRSNPSSSSNPFVRNQSVFGSWRGGTGGTGGSSTMAPRTSSSMPRSNLTLPATGSRRSASSTASLQRTGSSTFPRSTSVNIENGVFEDGPLGELERRRRNLCIILFICEMYKLKLLAENVVYDWIHRLSLADNDLTLEGICAILLHIGRFLDHERSQYLMNKVFVQLTYVKGRKITSSRISWMIEDVIDLRSKNWERTAQPLHWQYLLI